MLVASQSGLVLGILSYTSMPIDRSGAHLWVMNRDVETFLHSHPMREAWLLRLAGDPGVERVEVYLYGLASWHKPGQGSSDTCCVIGSRLEEGALGAVSDLTPAMRSALSEPGAVVVDRSDLGRLGLSRGVGEVAEVAGRRVRVVGLVKGFVSTTSPYVLCSLETARRLLPLFQERPDLTMYLLARCRSPADASAVAARLRAWYPDMAAFTREDFSRRTRLYWLTQFKAGIAMGFTGVLALVVGLVVTSQTLYAAVAASLREYAVLEALGIPTWRMAALVLAQSFWIGLVGMALALPGAFGVAGCAGWFDIRVLLPGWLLSTTAAATLATALFSGLAALRSLRLIEPTSLLR
jgi:putative ABC transport system permease protein